MTLPIALFEGPAAARRPYPAHLIEEWRLPDGTPVTIRPIRAADCCWSARLSSACRPARATSVCCRAASSCPAS